MWFAGVSLFRETDETADSWCCQGVPVGVVWIVAIWLENHKSAFEGCRGVGNGVGNMQCVSAMRSPLSARLFGHKAFSRKQSVSDTP